MDTLQALRPGPSMPDIMLDQVLDSQKLSSDMFSVTLIFITDSAFHLGSLEEFGHGVIRYVLIQVELQRICIFYGGIVVVTHFSSKIIESYCNALRCERDWR